MQAFSSLALFEYQARDLFEAQGVPVPRGIVARTPKKQSKPPSRSVLPVTVVKAQVKTVTRQGRCAKVVRSPKEAAQAVEKILGMDIKGHTVHQVMVAEGIDIAEEYYFSLLVDRAERRWLAMQHPGRHGHRDVGRRASRSAGLGSCRPQGGHRRRQGWTRSWTLPGSTRPTA